MNRIWNDYLAEAQLNLLICAYTKVPSTWQEFDYVPEFNKLYFPLEGEGFLSIGDTKYVTEPGTLYLLPAGVLQSISTTPGDTLGKYWCHFTASIGELRLFDLLRTPHAVRMPDHDKLKQQFEQLIECQHRDDLAARLRIRASLLEILATFLESSEEPTMQTLPDPALDKIRQVLEHIDRHLGDPISLNDLAAIAHFQPNYFIGVFKKYTGRTPIQYINRMRLEKAKQLLTFTAEPVSAVAEQLGMELHYFSRSFKEYTGHAPTRYRELMGFEVRRS